jgi:hypothetical protein
MSFQNVVSGSRDWGALDDLLAVLGFVVVLWSNLPRRGMAMAKSHASLDAFGGCSHRKLRAGALLGHAKTERQNRQQQPFA